MTSTTPPALPSRKRFFAERAERESVHGVQRTREFDFRARQLLYEAFLASFQSWDIDTCDLALSKAAEIMRAGTELNQFSSSFRHASTEVWDSTSDEEYQDWLAASLLALLDLEQSHNGYMSADHEYAFAFEFRPEDFVAKANDILLERRIDFVFIDNELKLRGAEPLHQDVIKPVEALLTSHERFSKAESAYQDAVSSMATGGYGAAITSAGSALQETFEALGARGNDLGALFSDARKRHFLRGHDEKLLAAIKSISEWITADRSDRGNAHGASGATRDDADFAVHVIASLIIRLIRLAPADDNSP